MGIERPALPEQINDYATIGMVITDVWRVVMTEVGPNRIAVMKTVRELLRLGLREARDLVDATPVTIREELPRDAAEAIAERLTAAGASVEVR